MPAVITGLTAILVSAGVPTVLASPLATIAVATGSSASFIVVAR